MGGARPAPKVARYAVLPLSKSSGLIEWVPHTRPLVALYRDAARSRNVTRSVADWKARQSEGGAKGRRPRKAARDASPRPRSSRSRTEAVGRRRRAGPCPP